MKVIIDSRASPAPDWSVSSWIPLTLVSRSQSLDTVSISGSPHTHWLHSVWALLNAANVSRTCSLMRECLPDLYLLSPWSVFRSFDVSPGQCQGQYLHQTISTTQTTRFKIKRNIVAWFEFFMNENTLEQNLAEISSFHCNRKGNMS